MSTLSDAEAWLELAGETSSSHLAKAVGLDAALSLVEDNREELMTEVGDSFSGGDTRLEDRVSSAARKEGLTYPSKSEAELPWRRHKLSKYTS